MLTRVPRLARGTRALRPAPAVTPTPTSAAASSPAAAAAMLRLRHASSAALARIHPQQPRRPFLAVASSSVTSSAPRRQASTHAPAASATASPSPSATAITASTPSPAAATLRSSMVAASLHTASQRLGVARPPVAARGFSSPGTKGSTAVDSAAPATPGGGSLSHLFDANRSWAAGIVDRDPDFFPRLARQQQPEYLWIGCSDSRVPANQIIGLLPGEVFVHRNIANVVVHTDLNCLSVLQYAVDMLKVKHIMVVGHYGCGGVQAAMRYQRVGLVDNWLRHIQDVKHKYDAYLNTLPGEDEHGHAIGVATTASSTSSTPAASSERAARLCELNVIEQVANICSTTIVQDAWTRGQPLMVHGWIYSLQDGLMRDLGTSANSHSSAHTAHKAAVAAITQSTA